MSTASIHTTTAGHGMRRYLSDVSNAARAFAAALFAARERQFVVQEVTVRARITDRIRMKSHLQLLTMANQHEQMQPSLASELRYLASRG